MFSLEDSIKATQELLSNRFKAIEKREKELAEREAILKEVLGGAEPSDVLEFNVGGRTGIATLRSTLTSIGLSMMAGKFSGKWDDSFARDAEGKIFLDHDPDLFVQLLNYLRMKETNDQFSSPPPSPPVSPGFDRLIAHYDIMLGVYPVEIVRSKLCTAGEITYEAQSYPHFSLASTDYATFEIASVGHNRKILEFEAVPGRFTRLQIGFRPSQILSWQEWFDAMNGQYVAGSSQHGQLSSATVREGSTIRCAVGDKGIVFTVGEEQRTVPMNKYNDAMPILRIQGSVHFTQIKYFH